MYPVSLKQLCGHVCNNVGKCVHLCMVTWATSLYHLVDASYCTSNEYLSTIYLSGSIIIIEGIEYGKSREKETGRREGEKTFPPNIINHEACFRVFIWNSTSENRSA